MKSKCVLSNFTYQFAYDFDIVLRSTKSCINFKMAVASLLLLLLEKF